MAKILRLIESLDPKKGGPAYSVRESSRILSERGHDITVVTLDNKMAPPIDASSLGFNYLPLGPGLGKFGLHWPYLRWLRKNSGQFDLAIVHGVWQWPSMAYRMAASNAARFVVMPHGSLDVWDRAQRPWNFRLKQEYWRRIEHPLYRCAQEAWFTAEAELAAAQVQFDLSNVRARVVPYGAASAGEPRLECAPTDSLTFGYLGRIHPKKGVELVLEAFAEVVARQPAARLRIAGTGATDYVQTLVNKAAVRGLTHHVEWLGALSGVAKRDMLASLGLFILPSLQENFGLAVAESLSVGTPVLLSKYVNVQENVTAHDAGLVVDRTQQALSAAMMTWLSMPQSEIQTFRTNAQRCFVESMSLTRHVDYIEGLL